MFDIIVLIKNIIMNHLWKSCLINVQCTFINIHILILIFIKSLFFVAHTITQYFSKDFRSRAFEIFFYFRSRQSHYVYDSSNRYNTLVTLMCTLKKIIGITQICIVLLQLLISHIYVVTVIFDINSWTRKIKARWRFFC